MEQEPNTARCQHSLLHWESLFVTPTSNFEDVAFKFLQVAKSQSKIDQLQCSSK